MEWLICFVNANAPVIVTLLLIALGVVIVWLAWLVFPSPRSNPVYSVRAIGYAARREMDRLSDDYLRQIENQMRR